MAIPKEILEIERPSSTRVKEQNGKYMVIKRTSVLKNGKPVPVELGVIGHIIDGKYVPKQKRLDISSIEFKEYAGSTLAYRLSKDVLEMLMKFYNVEQAEEIFTYALIRAIHGDVPDKEIGHYYHESFISEYIPRVGVSKNTICTLLQTLGANLSIIQRFMRERISRVTSADEIVIDGMHKTNNSTINSFSNFSFKSRLKGSKDIGIMYAFNPKTGEPLASKVYAGNMLDSTTLSDFIKYFDIKEGVILGDKGFFTKENAKMLNNESVQFLFPLKRNALVIDELNLLDFENRLDTKDERILIKKVKKGSTYYYAFKNLELESQQKATKFEALSKNEFDMDEYREFEKEAGTIVFETNIDLDPNLIYEMYERRWDIEVMFNYYKNIVDLSHTRKHKDISIIGNEFVNFITILISTKIKKYMRHLELHKSYSYKGLFKILNSINKAKNTTSDWEYIKLTKKNIKLLELLSLIDIVD